MARQARLVVPGIVHHAVARGVNGTTIFRNGWEKGRYLKRAAQLAFEEQIQVHGYCLLNNHVHFLLTPATGVGLGRFFSRLHTWWAGYFNRKHDRSGHLFQCRYFSSPLSESHYWTALRYVDLNPVRAKLVKHPADWPWSSAREHLQITRSCSLLPVTPVQTRARFDSGTWLELLNSASDEAEGVLRRATRAGRPCGSPKFVRTLEQQFGLRAYGPMSAAQQSLTSLPG